MTTLRWDLFHEANYMETVRDERTALLEARRYKAVVNGYPLILLAVYALSKIVRDEVHFVFYGVLILPMLLNNVMALRDGTLLVDESARIADGRFHRFDLVWTLIVLPCVMAMELGTSPDDLRRAVFVPWLVVNLCWLVYVLAHGWHLKQLAGEELELPPVSRFEKPARVLWVLALAASLVLSGAARTVAELALDAVAPGSTVLIEGVPAELQPLRGVADPAHAIPEDGELRVLTFRNRTIDGEGCGLYYIARQGDEAVRLGLTIRDGQVTAGRMSHARQITDPGNGSRYWTDWSDSLRGEYKYWRDGAWRSPEGVGDLLSADERLCGTVWFDPVLDPEELARTRVEDDLYRLWYLSGWSDTDVKELEPDILSMQAYRLNGNGAAVFHQFDQGDLVYAWQRVGCGTMEELNAQLEGAFVPEWYSELLTPEWVSRDFD